MTHWPLAGAVTLPGLRARAGPLGGGGSVTVGIRSTQEGPPLLDTAAASGLGLIPLWTALQARLQPAAD